MRIRNTAALYGLYVLTQNVEDAVLHLEEMLVVLLLNVELLLLPQLQQATLVRLQGLAHRKPKQ